MRYYDTATTPTTGKIVLDGNILTAIPENDIRVKSWFEPLPEGKQRAFTTDGLPILEDVPVLTSEELAELAKPKVVTMRQARLALLQQGLLTAVTNAIINGTDEAMKIEWEYAIEVKRDWPSLIALATTLGLTPAQLDDLFKLASTL